MNRRTFFSRLAVSLVSLPAIGRAVTTPRTLWFDGENDYLKTAKWDGKLRHLPGVSGNYFTTTDSSALKVEGDVEWTIVMKPAPRIT
jgi:hypothetical protein